MIEHCLAEQAETEAALKVAVSLPSAYWWGRGLFGEGRRWLDHALAQAPKPTGLRARALILDAELAYLQGDGGTGTRLLEEGELLARQLNHADAIVHATVVRGLGAMYANGAVCSHSDPGGGRTHAVRGAAP